MFKSEIQFENSIRDIISSELTSNYKSIYALKSKDVFDIIICNDIKGEIYFIETKFYTKKKGRIGFGDKNGEGFQVEILEKKPKYFRDKLIWIFGTEDDDKYYLVTNKNITKYFNEINNQTKQNNFKKKVFSEENRFNKQKLSKYLIKWITKKNKLTFKPISCPFIKKSIL